MNCKFCNRECKNNNSLRQHEIRCKSNPNKIEVKVGKGVNAPNYGKKGENRFTKARKEGREVFVSNETKKKISSFMKTRTPIPWSKEKKEKTF